jgi:hypothetical protein
MKDCPFCYSAINPNAVVCPVCKQNIVIVDDLQIEITRLKELKEPKPRVMDETPENLHLIFYLTYVLLIIVPPLIILATLVNENIAIPAADDLSTTFIYDRLMFEMYQIYAIGLTIAFSMLAVLASKLKNVFIISMLVYFLPYVLLIIVFIADQDLKFDFSGFYKLTPGLAFSMLASALFSGLLAKLFYKKRSLSVIYNYRIFLDWVSDQSSTLQKLYKLILFISTTGGLLYTIAAKLQLF